MSPRDVGNGGWPIFASERSCLVGYTTVVSWPFGGHRFLGRRRAWSRRTTVAPTDGACEPRTASPDKRTPMPPGGTALPAAAVAPADGDPTPPGEIREVTQRDLPRARRSADARTGGAVCTCRSSTRLRRIIQFEPCDGVKRPRVNRHEMVFITTAQVDVLATVVEDTWRSHGYGALVRFAANSACRAGDEVFDTPTPCASCEVAHESGTPHRIVGGKLTLPPPHVQVSSGLADSVLTQLAARRDPSALSVQFARASGYSAPLHAGEGGRHDRLHRERSCR